MTATETPSDETNARQLQMAKDEGAAYQRSLDYMVNRVADTGAKQRAGDYIIGIAQERAEGMYALKGDGQLEWTEPEEENCHLEVSVSDAADNRFIPALDIEATLLRDGDAPIGPFKVPFLWHPGLYHYGRNIKVPGDGVYAIRLRIAPPNFMRHDKENGKRYASTVVIEFPDVKVTTGQE